ncbi:DUF397 domain-containing protein [Kineosporia mesophila]|uniref:DUF397 domain-containing protein n=1 Tax=Kineosporia mesophila TaxID=566012 RepID=A0ABP6ZDA1_9ACTN|nr:DUF397 domain-containing protein [Kineosporia mesophila]
MTNADWIKSAKSANSGECVEMRRHDGAIQIRDSKNPEGAVLSFTPGELDAWIDGAKKNEFDHLL